MNKQNKSKQVSKEQEQTEKQQDMKRNITTGAITTIQIIRTKPKRKRDK